MSTGASRRRNAERNVRYLQWRTRSRFRSRINPPFPIHRETTADLSQVNRRKSFARLISQLARSASAILRLALSFAVDLGWIYERRSVSSSPPKRKVRSAWSRNARYFVKFVVAVNACDTARRAECARVEPKVTHDARVCGSRSERKRDGTRRPLSNHFLIS